MLIVGNMSTGKRTRLTVPTTAIMRQTTMMKYGLRMEKPDLRARHRGFGNGQHRTQPRNVGEAHQRHRLTAGRRASLNHRGGIRIALTDDSGEGRGDSLISLQRSDTLFTGLRDMNLLLGC